MSQAVSYRGPRLGPGFWTWVAVGFGLLARVIAYVANRPLRWDESMLAVNIVGRPLAEILSPLEEMQAAPILFLIVEKVATLLLGGGELALRLFPFLTGLLAIFAFRSFSCRVLTPSAALVAIVLFSCCQDVIFCAADAKQYSSDVLASLLIIGIAISVDRARLGATSLLALGVTGLLAIPLSHPSCYVLAAAGLGLWSVAQRSWRNLAKLGALGIVWLAVFTLCYRSSLAMSDVTSLRDFWKEDFVPLPPASWSDARWAIQLAVKIFRQPMGIAPAGLGLLLFVLGCRSLYRRNRSLLVMLAMPPVLAYLTSCLQFYPFHGRFLLFTTPLVLPVIAEGTRDVVQLLDGLRRPRVRQLLKGGVLALVLWSPVEEGLAAIIMPRTKDCDLRSIVARVRDRLQGVDTLYIEDPEEAMLRYYRWRFDLQGDALDVRPAPDLELFASQGLTPEQLREYRETGKAWFVFTFQPARRTGFFRTHTPRDSQTKQERIELFRKALEGIGNRVDSLEVAGAWADLYVFSE
ncbi:MAG: hypothetical protein AB1486_25050 [Planctomycetota bacterium]